MPLPAALLNKLKQRGIVKSEEEVIAESYDEPSIRNKKVNSDSGAPGCPNKWNPYHCCVEFCYDHWREGMPESRMDERYNLRRLRMLKRYPLPVKWREVYDPGMARHYYWNMETDEVSWLSPSHPRAVIGESAPKLARALFEKIDYQKELALSKLQGQSQRGGNSRFSRSSRRDERREHREERRRSRSKSGSDSDRDEQRANQERVEMKEFDKLRRAKKRGIDPMDPAAYGDNVPTGKWSMGLESVTDAKTGADVTASGPLFQSRPYPAPGAILRKNVEANSQRR